MIAAPITNIHLILDSCKKASRRRLNPDLRTIGFGNAAVFFGGAAVFEGAEGGGGDETHSSNWVSVAMAAVSTGREPYGVTSDSDAHGEK